MSNLYNGNIWQSKKKIKQNIKACYDINEHQKTLYTMKKLLKNIKFSISLFCNKSRKVTFIEIVIGSAIFWD